MQNIGWHDITGVIAASNGALFAWHLAPSFGNRGANYSGYVSYVNIAKPEIIYSASWKTHDDFSEPFGLLSFSPSPLAVPHELRRHAARVFKLSGFLVRDEESDLEREARYWVNTYRAALSETGSVAMKLAWNAGTRLSADDPAATRVGSSGYTVPVFRISPVVQTREDGSWAVIYVGSSFPTLSNHDGLLIIKDVGILIYEPETGILRKSAS